MKYKNCLPSIYFSIGMIYGYVLSFNIILAIIIAASLLILNFIILRISKEHEIKFSAGTIVGFNGEGKIVPIESALDGRPIGILKSGKKICKEDFDIVKLDGDWKY